MKFNCFRVVLFFLIIAPYVNVNAQWLPAGYPILEEALRRKQLIGELNPNISFNQRPIQANWTDGNPVFPSSWGWFEIGADSLVQLNQPSKVDFAILPLRNITRYASGRPSGHSPGMITPSVGWQTLWSAGVELKHKYFHLVFQPEYYYGQNQPFEGFSPKQISRAVNRRVVAWQRGDIQELFWDGSQHLLSLGNSKFAFQFGAFEAGVSTQNLWWGPGQFHALIFSNSAQGFPYLTINTTKPAKTFLGNFEGQLLAGKLENRYLVSSQSEQLNNLRNDIPDDWRYLNAFTLSYNPKWIPGLFLGVSRTFQQFNFNRGNSFGDWLPVLEPFQKERFFEGGNTVEYDGREQDQQVSFFSRVIIPKSQFELYFEFGKRDHNLNWREFILNPEHARAYLVGFNKLINTTNNQVKFQVRGEMLQTSNSINQIVRYQLPDIQSWHMHFRALGYKNQGQFLGTNLAMAGNSQILEISRINKLQKIGLAFERLENGHDFFRSGFLQVPEAKPWIDFSTTALITHQFGPLLVDLRLKAIHAYNYQWEYNIPTNLTSMPSVPRRTDFLMQWHLYYMIPDGLLRKK